MDAFHCDDLVVVERLSRQQTNTCIQLFLQCFSEKKNIERSRSMGVLGGGDFYWSLSVTQNGAQPDQKGAREDPNGVQFGSQPGPSGGIWCNFRPQGV